MSLFLVPTPIGNKDDFTLRAIEVLKRAHTIIVEEFKESSRQLRSIGISGKTLEPLNEHSTPEDYQRLLNLCQNQEVALVTDCGTPGFCDPGGQLVGLCRKANVRVTALPGASSLMTTLSLAGRRLDQFLFRGFLPAERVAREKSWQELKQIKVPIIIMDTPYRFKKTLQECSDFFSSHQVLVTANLTQESEEVFEGAAKNAPDFFKSEKAEFLLVIYP